MKKTIFLLFLVMLFIVGCSDKKKEMTELTLSGLDKNKFETHVDGKKTRLYVLKNSQGMEVCITNYGGRIVSIMVPDKNAQMRDIVLGFDSIQGYIDNPSDIGASVGRYASRIRDGQFELDGVEYQLSLNNKGHTLHGGPKGFQFVVFNANQTDNKTLEFTYMSADGDEGFPGNLSCKITYSLTDDNAVNIKYEAETDKATIVNLSSHPYFNPDGNASGKDMNWFLTINADMYTPIDSSLVTTGKILPVINTDMDFRSPTLIGNRLRNYTSQQLKNGNGYDHNWILNANGDINQVAAHLESTKTGIVIDVYTTEPGVQFYTGNFLNGSYAGKKGIIYEQRCGVCLNTQKYPDSPNKKDWPSPILRPGENYTSETIYKFSVKQ